MTLAATTSKFDAGELTVLLPRLELTPEAAACIDGCVTVSEAVARLTAGGFLLHAVRLSAHALPNREAVWWAAQCANHTEPADLPSADRTARELAERWVRRPSDETRRAAMEQAEAAGFTSPEAWVAVAVFWSGDSMSPLGQPKLPPAPHLAGIAVAGAVALAAVRTKPEQQEARLRRFLASACDIAGGGAGRLAPEMA
jgi:hypothetical protein